MMKKMIILLCVISATTLFIHPETQAYTQNISLTTTEQTNSNVEEKLLDLIEIENLEEFDFEAAELTSTPSKDDGEPTLRQKLQLFWALPRAIKLKLLKDHIKNHRTAYAVSGIGSMAAIAILIAILTKKKK